MNTLPSTPVEQVTPVVPLSEREAEEFLAGFDMDQDWHHHTVEELVTSFRSLSGETQRLLVRGFESGLVASAAVIQMVDAFGFVVLKTWEWDETGNYESLAEANAVADGRLFSTLLVLEHLGSSLDPLGHPITAHSMWAEMALNGFVDVSETEYPNPEDFRLSTVEDVAAVAAITTYVAVDGFLHNLELDEHGRDTRDILVVTEPDIFPRCSEGEGVHCDSIVLQHPELEHKLRGRSLDDYKAALSFVREHGWLGFGVEGEEFSLEHLVAAHSALAGGCL